MEMGRLAVFVVVAALVLGAAECGAERRPVARAWQHMEDSLKSVVDNLLKQLMPTVLKASSSANVTGDCAGGLLQVILGLRRMTPWAFRMLDAAGKPPPGILKGTVTAMGAYDECLAISVPSELEPDEEHFRGQYCTVTLVPPLPPKKPYYTLQGTLDHFRNFSESGGTVIREISRVAHLFYFLTYRFDVCVPSVCTKQDLENLINHAIKNFNLQVTVPECNIKQPMAIPPYIIFILIVFGILIALGMAGGFIDFLHETFPESSSLKRYTSHSLCRLLDYFSLISNTERVLETTSLAFPRTAALYGMTFLTTTWIVLANSYFDMNLQIFSNLFEMTQYPRSFAFQVIINSTLSADTYFFISGVLTVYTTLVWVRDTGRFQIWHYLLRRLWRILPPYALMIGVFLVLGAVGDGPSWHQSVNPVVGRCSQNWWTNLLFINNLYLAPEERCLKTTWYISCDMQLYLIALLVILPLLRWKPAVGLTVDAVLVLASLVTSGYITYSRGYPPTLLMAHPDPAQRSDWEFHLLNQPLAHLASHGVGMAVGWMLYRREKLSLRWYYLVGGWAMAGSLAIAVIYGVYQWNNEVLPSVFVTVLYASTHRAVWALSLAWVTVVCAYGIGGYVEKMLSWSPLVPLSRLTLLVLLLHPMLQLSIVGYLQERIYTTHTMAIFFFLGQLACSLGLSFVLSLLVERPFLALRRRLLSWPPSPASQDEERLSKATKEDEAKLYLSNGELVIVAPTKPIQEKVSTNQPPDVAVCHL